MIVLGILLKMPHIQFLLLKHCYSPAFIFHCSICQEAGTCISGGQRRKDPVSCGPCWPDCGVKMVQERTRDPPYSKVCHLLFLHALFLQLHSETRSHETNANLFKNPSFIVFFGLLVTGDAETHPPHMLHTHASEPSAFHTRQTHNVLKTLICALW